MSDSDQDTSYHLDYSDDSVIGSEDAVFESKDAEELINTDNNPNPSAEEEMPSDDHPNCEKAGDGNDETATSTLGEPMINDDQTDRALSARNAEFYKMVDEVMKNLTKSDDMFSAILKFTLFH